MTFLSLEAAASLIPLRQLGWYFGRWLRYDLGILIAHCLFGYAADGGWCAAHAVIAEGRPASASEMCPFVEKA